jgi:S1-C subfamily serine protease
MRWTAGYGYRPNMIQGPPEDPQPPQRRPVLPFVVAGVLAAAILASLAVVGTLILTSRHKSGTNVFGMRSLAPPDPALTASSVLRQAEPSIVKIKDTAPSCHKQFEGTGFVYATDRIITNAHVVGGTDGRPQVFTPDGREMVATVVLFDARRDVAVLYVPGLRLPALIFNDRGKADAGAVIAGYPDDGSLRLAAARIQLRQAVSGPDIYKSPNKVTREVFWLSGAVQPGNSGSPLLAPDGTVYGLIFAADITNSQTGYALTASEVGGDAAAGRGAVQQVGTQHCAD